MGKTSSFPLKGWRMVLLEHCSAEIKCFNFYFFLIFQNRLPQNTVCCCGGMGFNSQNPHNVQLSVTVVPGDSMPCVGTRHMVHVHKWCKTLIHIKQSCIFLEKVFLPQCYGWQDCEASDLKGIPLIPRV